MTHPDPDLTSAADLALADGLTGPAASGGQPPVPGTTRFRGTFGELWLDGEDFLTHDFREHGWYEPDGVALCVRVGLALQRVEGPFVTLDVGANVGFFAVPLARTFEGPLVAFEPNPVARRLLAANLSLNDLAARVDIRAVALGRQAGEVRLSLPPVYEGRPNLGATWVDPAGAGEPVPLAPLDALGLGSVRLVKMDVEGFEHEVLLGGRALLRSEQPVLYLELIDAHLRRAGSSARAVLDLLADLGYAFWRHEANVLAVPAMRRALLADVTRGLWPVSRHRFVERPNAVRAVRRARRVVALADEAARHLVANTSTGLLAALRHHFA